MTYDYKRHGYNHFVCRYEHLEWHSDLLLRPTPAKQGVGKAISGFEECQQISAELIFVCVSEAVGCAGVDLQGRVLNKLR